VAGLQAGLPLTLGAAVVGAGVVVGAAAVGASVVVGAAVAGAAVVLAGVVFHVLQRFTSLPSTETMARATIINNPLICILAYLLLFC